MEETRKSPNGHGGDKKMVIRVGGGGGGIGAVVLLGGALATAALVSAFSARRKRRSSGEDSSREINKKKEDNIIRKGGEEVGSENDSTAVISDPSLKLDDKAKCESDGEKDAVSEDGFIIVKEEIPLLAEKFKVEFVTGDDEPEEGDGEVKEIEAREEEKSEEFSNGNGEINEEKCVEKTILPLCEGHGDVGVGVGGEEEEVPLPPEGVEMVGADDDDKAEEKSVEEKKLIEVEIGGEERGGKIGESKGEKEIGGKGSMQSESESESESKWWKLAAAESKYDEVGGKMQEDRVKKQDDSSKKRAIRMIWMVCALSILSCSWFLELSSAKLALFLFLTVFLLEIYGFSLLNRHHHYQELLPANKDHKRGTNI